MKILALDYENDSEFKKIDFATRKFLGKKQLSTNISAVKLRPKYQKIYHQLIKLQKEVKRLGYHAFMLTLATYHTKSNKLESTYRILDSATKRLLKTKLFQKFIQNLELEFSVIVLETPYSDSQGWHCHYHLLLVTKYNLTESKTKELESSLTQLWVKLLQREGIGNNQKINSWLNQHGLKLQRNFKNFGYLAQLKKITSRRKNAYKGFSPLNLPALSLINPVYGSKFKEYERFIKGRELIRFSKTSFLGIIFSRKSEITMKISSDIDTRGVNTSVDNEVRVKSKWYPSLDFIFAKALKHYRIKEKFPSVVFNNFAFWLCRYSGIDIWKVKDFMKYHDANCFKAKEPPETKDNPSYNLILSLAFSFSKFFHSLRMIDGIYTDSTAKFFQERASY